MFQKSFIENLKIKIKFMFVKGKPIFAVCLGGVGLGGGSSERGAMGNRLAVLEEEELENILVTSSLPSYLLTTLIFFVWFVIFLICIISVPIAG